MRNIWGNKSTGLAEGFMVGGFGRNQKDSQVPGAEARKGWDPEVVMAREPGSGTLARWAFCSPALTAALLVLLRLMPRKLTSP